MIVAARSCFLCLRMHVCFMVQRVLTTDEIHGMIWNHGKDRMQSIASGDSFVPMCMVSFVLVLCNVSATTVPCVMCMQKLCKA